MPAAPRKGLGARPGSSTLSRSLGGSFVAKNVLKKATAVHLASSQSMTHLHEKVKVLSAKPADWEEISRDGVTGISLGYLWEAAMSGWLRELPSRAVQGCYFYRYEPPFLVRHACDDDAGRRRQGGESERPRGEKFLPTFVVASEAKLGTARSMPLERTRSMKSIVSSEYIRNNLELEATVFEVQTPTRIIKLQAPDKDARRQWVASLNSGLDRVFSPAQRSEMKRAELELRPKQIEQASTEFEKLNATEVGSQEQEFPDEEEVDEKKQPRALKRGYLLLQRSEFEDAAMERQLWPASEKKQVRQFARRYVVLRSDATMVVYLDDSRERADEVISLTHLYAELPHTICELSGKMVFRLVTPLRTLVFCAAHLVALEEWLRQILAVRLTMMDTISSHHHVRTARALAELRGRRRPTKAGFSGHLMAVLDDDAGLSAYEAYLQGPKEKKRKSKAFALKRSQLLPAIVTPNGSSRYCAPLLEDEAVEQQEEEDEEDGFFSSSTPPASRRGFATSFSPSFRGICADTTTSHSATSEMIKTSISGRRPTLMPPSLRNFAPPSPSKALRRLSQKCATVSPTSNAEDDQPEAVYGCLRLVNEFESLLELQEAADNQRAEFDAKMLQVAQSIVTNYLGGEPPLTEVEEEKEERSYRKQSSLSTLTALTFKVVNSEVRDELAAHCRNGRAPPMRRLRRALVASLHEATFDAFKRSEHFKGLVAAVEEETSLLLPDKKQATNAQHIIVKQLPAGMDITQIQRHVKTAGRKTCLHVKPKTSAEEAELETWTTLCQGLPEKVQTTHIGIEPRCASIVLLHTVSKNNNHNQGQQQHARIEAHPDGSIILVELDASSSFGVRVNGRLANNTGQQVHLTIGDVIQIGDTKLLYTAIPEGAQLPLK